MKNQTKPNRHSAGIKSKLNKIVWPYKYLSTYSICHQNPAVYQRIKCLRPQSCQQLLVLAIAILLFPLNSVGVVSHGHSGNEKHLVF